MKYSTVCTGIGAPEHAWKNFPGWSCQWQSEIDPFPCNVLKHHYPEVPNLGDMTQLLTNEKFEQSTIDLLAGGTPCQSFSLAGLRGGMADSRGNLALEFCRILIAKRPKWFIWENVPGVFSSFTNEEESKIIAPDRGTETLFGNDGSGGEGTLYEEVWQTSDFATLLQGFRECGYSVMHRVFDSQYFGVPQRRRRVFVVGYLGDDWRPPFAVLFEQESLRRDLTPVRKKKKGPAGNSGNSIEDGSGAKGFRQVKFHTYADDQTASALKQRDYKNATDLVCTLDTRNDCMNDQISGTVQAPGKGYSTGAINPVIYQIQSITNKTNRSNPKPGDPAPTLVSDGRDVACYGMDVSQRAEGIVFREQLAPTLTNANHPGHSSHVLVKRTMVIRRLTPTECERLQGFPDGYVTDVPDATDTACYKALGNSMTTFVMEWIGGRIQKVDAIINKHKSNV